MAKQGVRVREYELCVPLGNYPDVKGIDELAGAWRLVLALAARRLSILTCE